MAVQDSTKRRSVHYTAVIATIAALGAWSSVFVAALNRRTEVIRAQDTIIKAQSLKTEIPKMREQHESLISTLDELMQRRADVADDVNAMEEHQARIASTLSVISAPSAITDASTGVSINIAKQRTHYDVSVALVQGKGTVTVYEYATSAVIMPPGPLPLAQDLRVPSETLFTPCTFARSGADTFGNAFYVVIRWENQAKVYFVHLPAIRN